MKLFPKVTLALAICLSTTSFAQIKTRELDPILDAVCMVESSNNPHVKDGDHLHAIGQFQIHKEYWYDATHDKHGKQVFAGTYEDCRNKNYAEKIVIRYWQRYCPDAINNLDYKTLACIHHRGTANDNAKYWKMVEKYLEQ